MTWYDNECGGSNTPLSCETDSVTICPGDEPIPVTFDGGISVNLSCETDSITVCPGDDPIVVEGIVELGATTLTALETITVLQGTSPWVVSANNFTIRDLLFSTDKVDVSGSTVTITDGSGPITVDGTVAVTQSTSPWIVSGTVTITDGSGPVTVDGTITANQGTSPWVTSLDATTLTALENVTVQNGAGVAAVNIQDGGNSITVDGPLTDVQLRATPVPISGTVTVTDGSGPITVDGTVAVTNAGGTLSNGSETPVSLAAVQILAANSARKKYLVQNTGTANARIGVSGVTATTGLRLIPNGSIIVEMPDCPTQALFAIRETLDTIVFAQEVV